MRRPLAIASMAGLALALLAIFAVRAGWDRPMLAAVRAIDPRLTASMIVAAVLVQVGLFLRVREEEDRPTASRMARAPRSKMGRRLAMGTGSVSVIARRTGLPQDVVALALRQQAPADSSATREPATRQKTPHTASLSTDPVSLNGLIRRLTRS